MNNKSEYPVLSIDNTHYCACRVAAISTLAALGIRPEEYKSEMHRRLINLAACLLNPGDDRWTYDIRLIAQPDPSQFLRGTVTIAVLCCLRNGTMGEAANFALQLPRLLNAFLQEYEIEIVPAGQIQSLLRPFNINQIVSLNRRMGIEQLDTIRPGSTRQIGFAIDAASGPQLSLSPESIVHIYPFLPSFCSMNSLLKLLLMQPYPVTISCRFRPTTLQENEKAFLEKQIARCETAAQLNLRSPGESLASLKPTLQEQARLFRAHQGGSPCASRARNISRSLYSVARTSVQEEIAASLMSPLERALAARANENDPSDGVYNDSDNE